MPNAKAHSFFSGCTVVAGLLLTAYGLLLQTLVYPRSFYSVFLLNGFLATGNPWHFLSMSHRAGHKKQEIAQILQKCPS